MQTLFSRPECSPQTSTALWSCQGFYITVLDNCFPPGARIFRLHPGPVACDVVEIMSGDSERVNPEVQPHVCGSPLCSHLLLHATPLFKLEVFPLSSLVRWLCKWVNLRKCHFAALTNWMALQLHFPACYSPCTAQTSLPWCCLLRRHCCLLSLLFCRLSMLQLQGWLARGTFPVFTVIHLRLWILGIQTPPDSSEPASGFNPLQLMWLSRYRGKELEAILTWELLPVTAATWAFSLIQNMSQPFKDHLKSMGRDGLNCKIAIRTDNYHVAMCFLQDRVVEHST